jgi:hypothetical protein
MNDIFPIEDLKKKYSSAFDGDDVNYQTLALLLAQEVSDLQDQMLEKDYQILRITQRLDSLSR